MAGLMVYVLDRPADATILGKCIHAWLGGPWIKTGRLGVFGGIIPEFVHPFGFALLSIALFPRSGRTTRLGICGFWLTVELFFECGQGIGRPVVDHLIHLAPQYAVPTPVANYFVYGIYDPLDILAICLGITAAYGVAERTAKKSLATKQQGGLKPCLANLKTTKNRLDSSAPARGPGNAR